jgi:hypothetical protein
MSLYYLQCLQDGHLQRNCNMCPPRPASSSWLEVDLQCEEEDQVGLFLFSSNSDDVHASFCSDSVRGGLYRCSTYWRDTLNASQFVQSIVQDGYKIPFRSIPETCFLANNKSARDHLDFVSEAHCKKSNSSLE